MYLDHFGLREAPFRITPHTEFFFAGANRGATLDALIYAITHDEGIVKVSGEVGSGKTMLCRVLLERLPPHVVTVFLATPSLSRDDILHALADELHLPVLPSARSAQVVRLLQEHLIQLYAEGHQVVVLIDEAHAMPRETLEEIRLLSNLESNQHKLLQLVMFGQPELNDILARHDMRQLKERITHNFTLGPLGREEMADYIDFRLRAAGYKGAPIFSPTALTLMAGAALGLTRRINILADKALLAAYAAGRHEVGPEEAKAAIADCDFSVAPPPAPPRKTLYLTAAGLAAVAGILLLASYLTGQPDAAAESGAEPVPPATSTTDASASATTTTTSNASAPLAVATSEPSPATLIEQRLAAGQVWLQQAQDEHWFIQLRAMDADQTEQIEAALQKLQNQLPVEQTRAYLGKRGNTPRIGIIFGEYESHAQASQALVALPPEVQAMKPYLRQVRKLR